MPCNEEEKALWMPRPFEERELRRDGDGDGDGRRKTEDGIS